MSLSRFTVSIEARLRRLERRMGIDRHERSVWVWLIPPGVGLLTGSLGAFMPGLPSDLDWGLRLSIAIFGAVSMTAISGIYLISFDDDHNQQAPEPGPPDGPDDGDGGGGPPTPVGPAPRRVPPMLSPRPQAEAQRRGARRREKPPARPPAALPRN